MSPHGDTLGENIMVKLEKKFFKSNRVFYGQSWDWISDGVWAIHKDVVSNWVDVKELKPGHGYVKKNSKVQFIEDGNQRKYLSSAWIKNATEQTDDSVVYRNLNTVIYDAHTPSSCGVIFSGESQSNEQTRVTVVLKDIVDSFNLTELIGDHRHSNLLFTPDKKIIVSAMSSDFERRADYATRVKPIRLSSPAVPLFSDVLESPPRNILRQPVGVEV